MPKFHVSILMVKANNSPGTQFQLVVEDAKTYVDALEKAKPQLIQELKDAGLQVIGGSSEPEVEGSKPAVAP